MFEQQTPLLDRPTVRPGLGMAVPRRLPRARASRGAPPAPRVMVVLGTRPEAIKLAPVILALQNDPEMDVCTLSTGQHRDLLEDALRAFCLRPDHSLHAMREGQGLTGLLSSMLGGITECIREWTPGLVLVQGDTTTTIAGGFAAYYGRVPIGHVEAGLRTGDLLAPFPEEGNRRLVSAVADVHFAPTYAARANLLAEGTPPERIHVTGNTCIDALLMVAASQRSLAGDGPLFGHLGRTILVTIHRRENHGEPLRRVCRALRRLVVRRPDLQVVFPLHPNPAVRSDVKSILDGAERVRIVSPLDYPALIAVLRKSSVVLTDSGGLQEEAPSLNVPVLVLRDSTERPEGVAAGCSRLVGTQEEAVIAEVSGLLDDGAAYERMASAPNPYGDGRASTRIVEVCKALLGARAGRDLAAGTR